MKKVEARTEIGIAYRDYSTVVGEAWADVKVFAESPEGKKLSEFSHLLVSTIDKYRLALEVWKGKLDSDAGFDKELSDIILQSCWGAAGKRLKAAEALISGDDVAAELSRAADYAQRQMKPTK